MWTSSAPGHAPRLTFAVLLLLLATAPGWWGKKKDPPEPEPAEPVEAPEPAVTEEPEAPPPVESLFPQGLPATAGPVPTGLANLSAQGCNACHYTAHDAWAASGHATGWQSVAFEAAVAEAGTPACRVCHRPLVEQSADRPIYAAGDPNVAERLPNPDFDATLYGEGVTCAACHVRDGIVLGARPPSGEAPHPSGWSETLGTSAFCAACHQLTWPGADTPFYDTYGEWRQSPQAAAGIECQDCHMAAGASASIGPDHRMDADPARAVSLLVDVDRVDLVRGGNPLEVTIRLQNTGAGHAVPTGSPFKAVVLRARLVSPPQVEGDLPVERAVLEETLERTIAPEAPWNTVADTRLGAGGERRWSWQPALDIDDPGGAWFLEVTLWSAVRGTRAQRPFLEQRLPLTVD